MAADITADFGIFTLEQSKEFINDQRNSDTLHRVLNADDTHLVIELRNEADNGDVAFITHGSLELLVQAGDRRREDRGVGCERVVSQSGSEELQVG